VDGYIKKAAPFAQPILGEFREIVHAACPEVEEAMKWSFPHFLYKGMLCSMASFKEHAAFGLEGLAGDRRAPTGRCDATSPHCGAIRSAVDQAHRLREESDGAERAGREGASAESPAENRERARRSHGGAQKERKAHTGFDAMSRYKRE
jgi:hypothetical protein